MIDSGCGSCASVGGLLLFYAGPRTDLAGMVVFGAAIAVHLVRTRRSYIS